ncbi:hypothetical protein Dimus_019992, partial [Dionaea muscipula]
GRTPSSLSTELVNYKVNQEHAVVVIVAAGGSAVAVREMAVGERERKRERDGRSVAVVDAFVLGFNSRR